MSKEYIIKDDVYLTLLKYFKGDVIYLNAEILKDLKNGIFKGVPVKPIEKGILKVFVTILKLKKQKPELYANMKWIYPEWDKQEKEKKLREYFPEDFEEEETGLELKLKEEDEVNIEDRTYAPDSPPGSPIDKPPFLKGDDPINIEDRTYAPGSPRDPTEKKTIFFIKELSDGNKVYLNELEPGDSDIVRIKPNNGKNFTYEEQIDILVEFYRKYEPKKTKEEIKKIVDRRRQKGLPIRKVEWLELCDKLAKKYGFHPLDTVYVEESIQPSKIVEEIKEDIFDGIIPQRKAFIEWINNIFYKTQIKDYKQYIETLPIPENNSEKIRSLKLYQYFVKEYLSIETPFRGLLVYHGLGTGKTATSVVTAEGLSKTMPIFTFLPASLETEFIKEVRGWGDTLFNVDKNNWTFYPLQEIKGDLRLRRMLNDNYGINEKTINEIVSVTKRNLKKVLEEDEDMQTNIQNIMKKINEIKGIYLQSSDIKTENRTIYTHNGEPLLKEGETFKGECLKLKEEQKMYIEQQINFLIKLKYNFIHYNGFPEVDKVDVSKPVPEELQGVDSSGTSNQRLVNYFVKKYQENERRYGILSPFKENVIVIDEVHNFVNEIMNGSAPATVFYNWIINSEDVKIIFLSGTPVINKPAEIAILYNMLRGILHVFNFTILSDRDDYEVQQELREYFYKKNSSIEQLNVSKQKGKLVVSFTKNKTNYESIMEDDIIKTIKFNNHDYDSFFNEIMDGLTIVFNEDSIKPSKEQLKSVSIIDLKKGKPNIFDDDLNIIFNRKQRLFDIYENESIIDLSNNEQFMEYFFDDNFKIPDKKQVLLRRMLIGLTSYYPIDRSSIVNMPEIIEPKIIPKYKDYNIVNNINIVPCFMSSIQWVNYEDEYLKEKAKKIQQLRKKHLYNDKENSTFNIRTRQNCNIVYEDDSFRTERDEIKKDETYRMMSVNGHFSYDSTLKLYSPKFFNIMKNMQKFVNQGKPTGKILYYSDFRHESGSEAFEKILIQNGYEKYNSDSEDINELISKNSMKKRYTFITGKESQEQRKINKDSFNHIKNLTGEYIQLILISSSGAEGISLKAVRQVHVMEPFWNYIRVDQVLGRAARMESHIDLAESERNVEQYLYVSMLPEGNTFEDIYESLKELEWSEVNGIDVGDGVDLKKFLNEKHKQVYKTITKILSMKKETNDRTVDQILFDIMERKNNIASKITDIIKEASVDCIQNTRDDIQLNEKCLRYSKKVLGEEAHFPGITSAKLNEIDQKQFKSNFIYHIKPDNYVVLAKKDEKDIFIYYRVQDEGNNVDIRYIRENGIRLGDYDPFTTKLVFYEKKDHLLNKKLGTKFSVFQSIYEVPEYLIQSKIDKSIFPRLEEIISSDNLEGYTIKYNISEKLFYSPNKKTSFIRLYNYDNYLENYETIEESESLILRNGKLFKTSL